MLGNSLCQFLWELWGYHQGFSIFILPIASIVWQRANASSPPELESEVLHPSPLLLGPYI